MRTMTSVRTWVRRAAVAGVTAAALTGVLPSATADLSLPLIPTTTATKPAPALPTNFLWGVASAGFQVEGHTPDSNWSRYVATKSTDDPIGNADDFYDRYTSDIALAQQMGVKVYRISIEWARLEPQPGRYDPAAWAFYDRVVAAIRAAGMRPMLTIDHWVYPGWEASLGGWSRAGMVDDWLANAKLVVDRYKTYDPLWVTINEPVFYAAQEVTNGGLSPTGLTTMLDRLVTVHNTIYDYIHTVQPGAMVTSNVAYISGAESLADVLFLNRTASHMDFLGIDYYYPVSATDPISSLNALLNQPYNASLAPEGIYYALRHYAQAYPGQPLYIVENGMPTQDAAARPDGWTRVNDLQDTVYWLQRARAAGINVIGYNYWSLTDNYEWGSYTPRFGLYTVNAKTDPTLQRIPTAAVPAYTGDIARGGVPSGYQLSRPTQFCSLVDLLSSCLDPVS